MIYLKLFKKFNESINIKESLVKKLTELEADEFIRTHTRAKRTKADVEIYNNFLKYIFDETTIEPGNNYKTDRAWSATIYDDESPTIYFNFYKFEDEWYLVSKDVDRNDRVIEYNWLIDTKEGFKELRSRQRTGKARRR